jgi:HD-GYP domain-containing protein (c-di-GMP phosphodiesterase class II)
VTVGASHSQRVPASVSAEALLLRCAELGLPAWLFDGAGRPIAEPTRSGTGGRWLTSDVIRGMIAGTVAAALEEPGSLESAAVAELYPGCQLVLVPQRQGRRTAGVIAAMALAPGALEHSVFSRACVGAGLDPDAARAELGRIATSSEGEAQRLRVLLGWMSADLAQSARENQSVQEFGIQLTEMYEEIGLLYRLGRSMNRLTTPEQFVAMTCEELFQTLPFGWIAVKFGRTAQVVPALAGSMVVCGKLPCSEQRLDTQAHLVLDTLEPDGWKLMPTSEGAELTTVAGGPVLVHPISRDGLVVGAVLAGAKRGPDPEISSFETQLLDAASGYLSVFAENAGLYADQHALFMGTLEALTAAIDAKDRYTCGHSERVAYLAHELALAHGLSPAAAERVRISGLLHDVGKIGVPEAVLTKPGRLSEDEFAAVRLHPTIGHRILKDIPQLQDVLPGVLHHHERWDGDGYPAGLAGEHIPLIGRVLAVADAFDAMSSTRSYRAAMPRERALAEIARSAGTQLDPELARLFLAMDLSGYDAIVARHRQHLRFAA